MLQYMTESNKSEKEINFKPITEDDKVIEVLHKLVDFVVTNNDGTIEPLGDGLLAVSADYKIVVLGDIVRINYYPNVKSSIFNYMELDLRNGIGSYNIKRWSSELMQLYNDIINIANS